MKAKVTIATPDRVSDEFQIDTDMFPNDDDGNPMRASAEDIAEWKRLLVLTHVHKAKASALASVIAGELRARAKHYTKLQSALVEAIRYKSAGPLVGTFGSKTEGVLADVKPIDRFNQAVDRWWDDVKAELAEETE